MSFAIDINLLLYASDRASPLHAPAAAFLADTLGASRLFYLGWPTVMGYLRIATHPRVFEAPLSPREARENVDTLIAHPYARILSEREGFWEVYRDLTADLPVRGNLVPDAHLTAILLQHGVTRLYTNDADFRRFPSLEVRNPFEA